ncbi:hypothetical protein A3G63_01460 [Candidatus Kaiserbacteria bacterium RIFCSPLOWO2_12_FULL_52_8]|nr:MAG: hypothetical protein A3G63_01460 [Candidatus Kaiserbacteria bacterium RIFCSPLOWO2_12_FULL_52_8]
MYTVEGWCAGFLVFSEKVPRTNYEAFLEFKREQLENGELTITYCNGAVTHVIKELCIDPCDEQGNWMLELGVSYKV